MRLKNSISTAGNTRSGVRFIFITASTFPMMLAALLLLEDSILGGYRYCMRSVKNHNAICLEKTEIKHTWETPELSAQSRRSVASPRPDTLPNILQRVPPPYEVLLVPSPPPVGGGHPAPLRNSATHSRRT